MNRTGLGIEAEQVNARPLVGNEIDSIGTPVECVRILVEFCGEIVDVGWSGGGLVHNGGDVDGGDVRVRIIEIGLRESGSKGELPAVR